MKCCCITTFLFAVVIFLECGLSENIRLSALDNEDKWQETIVNGDFASRVKRSAQSSDVDPLHRVTVAALNDSHNTLEVHWAAEGSDVIIALAKNTGMYSSALYVSNDYGKSFTDVSDRMMVNSLQQAVVMQYYTVSKFNNVYIFTDVDNRCIFTSDDTARNFMRHCYLPFKPRTLKINPANPDLVLGMDEDNSLKQLYLSENFGASWRPIYSNVKEFHWGERPYDNATTIYIVNEISNHKLQLMRSHTFFNTRSDIETLLTDIVDFQMKDIYMYATKSVRLFGSTFNPHLQLWVSYNRGRMALAEFPGNHKLTDYFVADASEGQLMMIATVNNSYSNLYISEVAGLRFSLSLERIVYFNPEVESTFERPFDTEPYADIVKIHGVNGIYIASQEIDSSHQQRTLITYDKGGEWQLISAPEYTVGRRPSNCDTIQNCSLHLMQKFHKFFQDSRSLPILTQESAPGLVIASGMMGEILTDDPDVFVSSSAGIKWRQVLSGNYFYATGDHGGIIVAVHQFIPTDEVIYSVDEGETWHSYRIIDDKIRVYGLLTEPGENTTIFSVFGSPLTRHSWHILQIDFKNVFDVNCADQDYKMWSVDEELPDKDGCLLGHVIEYQRRVAHAKCYNGKDFVRETQTKNCDCTREDFECDFGYKQVGRACVRDQTIDDSDINPVPSPCPAGTFYSYSRGYRKVAGDTCDGGEEHKYGPLQYSCPIQERHDFLLITQGDQVSMVDLATEERVILFEDPISNIPAVFDYQMFCVVYIDPSSKIKKKCFSEGSTVPHLDQTLRGNRNNSAVSYLAFDWTGRNIYFGDEIQNEIRVLSINGTFEKELRGPSRGVFKPTAMAVDPHHGYMYFVGALNLAGDYFAIYQLAMDGNGTMKMVANSSYVKRDTSLVIDLEHERLYWVTPNYATVYKTNLLDAGGNISHTFHAQLSRATGIGVFKDYLYVSTNSYQGIFSLNKHTLRQLERFTTVSSVHGMVVVSSTSQHAMSACSNFHTQCSQLCLPRPNLEHLGDHNRTCACGEGYRFSMQPGSQDQTCLCEAGEILTSDGTCQESNNASTCAPDKLRCRNGNCVMMSWKCDGDDDCRDGTDEMDCPYRTCSSAAFTCKTGKCIPGHWQCDGEDDCRDGMASDELSCDKQNCTQDQFRCTNGYCIDKNWRCDDDNDCHDNSDEANCTVTGTCHSWEFACTSGMCIDEGYKCNQHNDCDDASDEADCAHHASCASWQFNCGDDQCIFDSWRCDGDTDCDNSEDEKNCNRTAHTTTSPSFCSYRCTGGFCIGWEDFCNGVNDCWDGSDERGCEYPGTTTAAPPPSCRYNEWMCRDGSSCVPLSARCNTHEDCFDGSDEENCESVCTSNQYQCESVNNATSECISKRWVCDNYTDCPKGDDERDCPGPAQCPPMEFNCVVDGGCVSISNVCNERIDCSDGSDEVGCSYSHVINCSTFNNYKDACCTNNQCGVFEPTFSYDGTGGICRSVSQAQSYASTNQCSGSVLAPYHCKANQFKCNDTKMTCVSFTQVCDHTDDCPSGQDEQNCPNCFFARSYSVSVESMTNNSVSWNLNAQMNKVAYAEQIPGFSKANLTWGNKDILNDPAPTVNGLKPATTYIFVFYANSSSPTKDCFVQAVPVKTKDGSPSKPTHLTLRVRLERYPPTYIVDVRWKKPEAPNGRITKYTIYYQQIDDKGKALSRVFSKMEDADAIVRASGFDYKSSVRENIKEKGTYDFWVVASTNNGEGTPSEKERIVIKEASKTTLQVSVSSLTETSFVVKWTKDKKAKSYKVTLHFLEAQMSGFGGSHLSDITKNVNTTSTSFEDLCPGSSVLVGVQAVYEDNSLGVVSRPNGSYPETTLKGALPNVTITSLEKTGPTSILLKFTEVADKNTPYFIYYTHDMTKDPMSHESLETSHEILGLLACEHYFLWIRPVSRYCPLTATRSFVTEEDELAPPKNLAADVVRIKDSYSLNLTWTAACFEISEPTNYIIHMDLATKPPLSQNVLAPPNPTSKTHLSHFFPHVRSSVVYHFTVRSNMAGSQESSRYTVQIPYIDGPTNLVVKLVGENKVLVRWDWPLAHAFEKDFKEYVVYTNGAGLSLTNHTTHKKIKLNLPGIGTYKFTVAVMTKLDKILAKSEPEEFAYDVEVAHTSDSSSQVNLVAILVPVGLVVVGLSAGLVFFIVRHKRLQRSFLAFANSHYNIQSGTTTFSDELDGDEPLIQGFSDDEPLVIA